MVDYGLSRAFEVLHSVAERQRSAGGTPLGWTVLFGHFIPWVTQFRGQVERE